MSPGPHGLTLAAALGATAVGYVTAGTPALVAAGACAAVVARPALRRARRQWTYITPTEDAIRTIVGADRVRLRVRGEIRPKPTGPLSPAELWVRSRYTRVEPVVRWAPDRVMRAWWTVRVPVARRVAWFRRPDPPRIKLTIRKVLVTSDEKAAVQYAISEKVPVGDVRPAWSQRGRTVSATWHAVKRPPSHVDLSALEAASALADHEFFVGLDSAGKPVIVSLEDDSPHIACSAGSGAGKSVLAMLLAVQVLRRGGRVIILDRKGSHRWARGVEGVTYCLKPEQMHDALVQLGEDAWRRQDEAWDAADGWTPDDRVLVIAEELNATFSWLRRYWTGRGEKGTSPAVIAFQDLLFAGRSAHHHVFAVAQMLTANTTGGPEARENFAVRCLARYSANAWKMLCAGVAMPRRSRVRGRWQIVVGDEATEVQVCYLTTAQARAFARAGGRVPESARVLDSPFALRVPGDRPPIGDIVDPLSEPITLRDAVDEGLFVTYAAAKKRVQRAGERAPQRAGKRRLADLYRRGDLIELAEQRAQEK